jgi:hypothetical protein
MLASGVLRGQPMQLREVGGTVFFVSQQGLVLSVLSLAVIGASCASTLKGPAPVTVPAPQGVQTIRSPFVVLNVSVPQNAAQSR